MVQRISRAWTSDANHDRPRLLVEDPSGPLADAEFEEFESAGFDVAVCTGPERAQGCSLVDSGHCALAEQADVILFGLTLADESRRDVVRALRRRFPATPVVVEVPLREADCEEAVPRGCRALALPTSIQGEVWAARQALEGARRARALLRESPLDRGDR